MKVTRHQIRRLVSSIILEVERKKTTKEELKHDVKLFGYKNSSGDVQKLIRDIIKKYKGKIYAISLTNDPFDSFLSIKLNPSIQHPINMPGIEYTNKINHPNEYKITKWGLYYVT